MEESLTAPARADAPPVHEPLPVRRQFQLLRYFSIASGLAVLLMMVVVGFTYYREEVADEVQAAEERNSVLAQTFANTIWPQFGAYLSRPNPHVLSPSDSARLHDTLSAMARRLPVTKIKIYQPSGVAVYSSEAKEIGENDSANPAFRTALAGKAVSELVFRGQRSESEDEISGNDVVSTYIPIGDDRGGVIAVFELYSDVSAAVARIRQGTLRLVLGLVALFAALYAVLLLVVAHADRILQRQYQELAENEMQIRSTNQRLQRSEESAAAASRAKTEFLSGMSHELRTPMNAILGFGQLLLSEPGEPLGENRRRFVEQILKAGRHLLELINEVLDLARIEAGKLVLSVEPVAVAGVLAECVPLVQNLADERAVRVDAYPAAGGLYVMADYMRLKQSLLNLVSNAVKYNRRGGSVSLRAEPRDGGVVRISVADTGPGIPAAKHGEIFRPFHRLSPDAAEVEGTGIGLALTRNFVNAMGGAIGFDSEVGRGTTFWIELPPAKEPVPQGGAHAARTEDPAGPRPGARTMLYVEDNPANVLLMEEIAKRMDLNFLTAHNAELGIDLARSRKPDLIVMDINLPQMSGYDALVQLKQFPGTAAIPVMALSASAMEKDVARGRAAGFVRYETKPVDVDHMVAAIRAVLEAPR